MTETAVAEKPSRADVELNVDRDAGSVQRALLALVACNGSSRKAERLLAEDGIRVDHSTLDYWRKNNHKEEYERLREQMLPEIRKRQADAHRALEQRQLKVSKQAAKIIAQRLPRMEDKDLINAMGKADIGSGIHAEKAQLLDDQPTQIVKRSAREVLRSLEGKGMRVVGEKVEAESEGKRVSVERFAAIAPDSNT